MYRFHSLLHSSPAADAPARTQTVRLVYNRPTANLGTHDAWHYTFNHRVGRRSSLPYLGIPICKSPQKAPCSFSFPIYQIADKLTCFSQFHQTFKLHAHRARLPPGPKAGKTGLAKPWLYFRELSAQYGDVVSVPGLSSAGPTIVLGSAQAAWDLLERRGAVYSSRPRFVVGGELLSGGLRGLMAPYGDFWRRWRRLLHSGFMQRKSAAYRPLQRLESAVLVGDLLRRPAGFRDHLERYAASVIVLVTYGRRVTDVAGDEVVRRNIEAMGRLTSVK